MDDDLRLACRLVEVASEIALSYFGTPIDDWPKADGSPVCAVDLAVERAMLDVLAAERPQDAVLAEESGVRGRSARRWILDPIDGTVAFLCGGRNWGTNVALEIDGELECGIISRPTERTMWSASRGGGAHVGGGAHIGRRRLAVSAVTALEAARVGGFLMPGSPVPGLVAGRVDWVEPEVCAVADLCEGRIEAVIDEGGHVWDRAAAAILVSESGGRVDDLSGGRRLDRPLLVYSNAEIGTRLAGLLTPITSP